MICDLIIYKARINWESQYTLYMYVILQINLELDNVNDLFFKDIYILL